MTSLTPSFARILIVEDHPLVREGLASRIELQKDMEVCGEAESLKSALAEVKATRPDLVIIDVELANSNGFDLAKELAKHFPSIKMLVVSAHDSSLYADRALQAGAHGYVNKRELPGNIIDALRTVLSGKVYLGTFKIEQDVETVICDTSNLPR